MCWSNAVIATSTAYNIHLSKFVTSEDGPLKVKFKYRKKMKQLSDKFQNQQNKVFV